MPDASLDVVLERLDQLLQLQQETDRRVATLMGQVEALGEHAGVADPLLSGRQVQRYLDRSRSWFFQARRDGRIPSPDRELGGPGGGRWYRSTVDRAFPGAGQRGQGAA